MRWKATGLAVWFSLVTLYSPAASSAAEVIVALAPGRLPARPHAGGGQQGVNIDLLSEMLSVPEAGPEEPALFSSRRGASSSECFSLRPAVGSGNKQRTGRCEPQSLPYARCRSGITTCRIGYENGPLTWFACEKKRGNTSHLPQSGSVLILAANARRGMPTGHVAYVEEAVAQSPTRYRLVFSHTNYDRKCSLETNIEATYDSAARTIDIQGGAWGAWGKGLSVAGFILE